MLCYVMLGYNDQRLKFISRKSFSVFRNYQDKVITTLANLINIRIMETYIVCQSFKKAMSVNKELKKFY